MEFAIVKLRRVGTSVVMTVPSEILRETHLAPGTPVVIEGMAPGAGDAYGTILVRAAPSLRS